MIPDDIVNDGTTLVVALDVSMVASEVVIVIDGTTLVA